MLKLFKKHQIKSEFDGWIRDHHAALFRHAMWLTGNQDIAADMVQETFFQAWRSIDSISDKDKALPWLLTILRRCIYREQRQQYRHHDTVAALREQETQADDRDGYQYLVIYNALDQLSINHREVFLLHHLHGFSYDEISEHLEIPKGTVMSRLSRARETLKSIDQQLSDNKVVPLPTSTRGSKKNG